jgi:ribosomal-protein-alanine N-acetyltransferase
MRTKRLILRELNHADARRIAVLAGDFDVARMTARLPHPYTEIDAEEWIRGIETNEFVRGIEYDSYLIGLIGYTIDANDRSAELGYWIGKPWWGQGFVTEAAEPVIRHAFKAARAPRVTCCHFIDNSASARVIEKLGFRCVGVNKAFCLARNAEVDTIIYERKRPMTAFLWRGAA